MEQHDKKKARFVWRVVREENWTIIFSVCRVHLLLICRSLWFMCSLWTPVFFFSGRQSHRYWAAVLSWLVVNPRPDFRFLSDTLGFPGKILYAKRKLKRGEGESAEQSLSLLYQPQSAMEETRLRGPPLRLWLSWAASVSSTVYASDASWISKL